MSNTVFGITPVGFVAKTTTEVVSDLETSFKSVYGQSIGSNPDGSIPAASSIGQEIAIDADLAGTGWETAQAVYSSMDPNQAVTPQLQIICAITGTVQKPATYSTSQVTCYGTVGTQLAPGRVLTVVGTGSRFDSAISTTDPNAPNTTLAAQTTAWAASTVYAAGTFVTSNGMIWQCVTPGTSATPAPTGAQFSTYTDGGGVAWVAVCATGLGVAIQTFTAEQTGPIAATPQQLSVIATPVNGWAGAFNPAAALTGTDLESEPALRARRVEELQAQGGGPPNSIQAAILALTDVEDCRVFVNNGDTAAGGISAHGVLVEILSTLTDQQCAQAVWNAVGAGIATNGSSNAQVTDSSGVVHTVYFQRPTAIPIYVSATVYYNPAAWPGTNPGAAVVAATESAIMNFALGYFGIGLSVYSSRIVSAITDGPQGTVIVSGAPQPLYPGSPYGELPAGAVAMPGVVDVTVNIGTAPSPATSTPITISNLQIATFNPSNFVITASTAESP